MPPGWIPSSEPWRTLVVALHLAQLVAVVAWAVLLFGFGSRHGEWRWVAFATVFVLAAAIWVVKWLARRQAASG